MSISLGPAISSFADIFHAAGAVITPAGGTHIYATQGYPTGKIHVGAFDGPPGAAFDTKTRSSSTRPSTKSSRMIVATTGMSAVLDAVQRLTKW